MGANNWTICPQCVITHKQNGEFFEERLREAYGKVSSEEYLKIVQAKETHEKHNFLDTLREDYEIGILDNVFEVEYHAECTECTFKFSFKTRETARKQAPDIK